MIEAENETNPTESQQLHPDGWIGEQHQHHQKKNIIIVLSCLAFGYLMVSRWE